MNNSDDRCVFCRGVGITVHLPGLKRVQHTCHTSVTKSETARRRALVSGSGVGRRAPLLCAPSSPSACCRCSCRLPVGRRPRRRQAGRRPSRRTPTLGESTLRHSNRTPLSLKTACTHPRPASHLSLSRNVRSRVPSSSPFSAFTKSLPQEKKKPFMEVSEAMRPSLSPLASLTSLTHQHVCACRSLPPS